MTTVEHVADAHCAFSWAYRRDAELMDRHLDRLGPDELADVITAAEELRCSALVRYLALIGDAP